LNRWPSFVSSSLNLRGRSMSTLFELNGQRLHASAGRRAVIVPD
jgi:hypothetical protein